MCATSFPIQVCYDFLHFFPRESCESEDATSLPSSYPSSPTENGTLTTDTRSRPNSKSTLEENAYEDIVGKHAGSFKQELCFTLITLGHSCIQLGTERMHWLIDQQIHLFSYFFDNRCIHHFLEFSCFQLLDCKHLLVFLYDSTFFIFM